MTLCFIFHDSNTFKFCELCFPANLALVAAVMSYWYGFLLRRYDFRPMQLKEKTPV